MYFNNYDIDETLEMLITSNDNFKVISILDTYTLEDIYNDITTLDVLRIMMSIKIMLRNNGVVVVRNSLPLLLNVYHFVLPMITITSTINIKVSQ